MLHQVVRLRCFKDVEACGRPYSSRFRGRHVPYWTFSAFSLRKYSFLRFARERAPFTCFPCEVPLPQVKRTSTSLFAVLREVPHLTPLGEVAERG